MTQILFLVFFLFPSLLPAAECPLADASTAHEIPIVSQPSYLKSIPLPVLGCEIQRIAGDPAAKLPDGQDWGAYARHQYSKNQPWNADGSLLILRAGSPNRSFYLLDGNDYMVKAKACGHAQQSVWHPILPSVRVSANGKLLKWVDIIKCKTIKQWALPFEVDAIGSYEGNPSADGKLVALGDTIGKDSAGRTFSRNIVIVDMETGKIGPIADIHQQCLDSGATACYVGWASVSPSGRYLAAHLYHRDADGKLNSMRGKRVYDIDSKTLAFTPRKLGRPLPEACNPGAKPEAGYILPASHSDMGFDALGREVVVGVTSCGLAGKSFDGKLLGGVTSARLSDGEVLALTDPANEAPASHVSLRNTRRPGWAYVTYHPASSARRFSGEIVAVALDGSKRVERIAHHHSVREDVYYAEPHAVPSQDGSRVLFASDWADRCSPPCGQVKVNFQSYVVRSFVIPDPADEIKQLREQIAQLEASLRDLESLLAEREERLKAVEGKLDAIRSIVFP